MQLSLCAICARGNHRVLGKPCACRLLLEPSSSIGPGLLPPCKAAPRLGLQGKHRTRLDVSLPWPCPAVDVPPMRLSSRGRVAVMATCAKPGWRSGVARHRPPRPTPSAPAQPPSQRSSASIIVPALVRKGSPRSQAIRAQNTPYSALLQACY